MDVQAQSHSPDLTAPLLAPEVLAGFEALSEGRCSVSELTRCVLDVCESDPETAPRVLGLLDDYASSGQLDRFDLRPLKCALERNQESGSLVPQIDDDDAQDADEGPAPVSSLDIDSGCCSRPATAAPPRVLRGRYVLEAEVGRGGMGTVYRALDRNRAGVPGENHYVALKVLGEQAARSPGAVQTLRHEYLQAQRLSHPGIVKVFDFDQDGDTCFVTMELIEGESLGALTRRLLPNHLPREAAIRILRELGDAVASAHDRGVLHLDLKPDNVMVDAEGHARVLDFGLARTQPAGSWNPEVQSPPAAATLAYASCERLVQERPDVRDDIFSFSCIAYELLSGNHPFERLSALHARKDGRNARRITSLSPRQWRSLKSGLAWSREDRPATMRELLRALALQPTPDRMMYRAAAVALLGIGAAAILSWPRIRNPAGDTIDEPANAAAQEPVRAVDPSRSAAMTLARASDVAAAIEPASAVAESPLLAPDAPVEARTSTEPTDSAAELTVSASEAPRSFSEAQEGVAAADDAPPAPPPTSVPDVLGFSRHSFPVLEADPVARMNVRRLGSAAGDISFRWYTVDDSARAGQDYVYGAGEVSMAAGQTTATFEVPIVADSVAESPELLQVIIGSANGARVGPAGRAPVIIVDDD